MSHDGSISQAIPNELQGYNSFDPSHSINPTAPAFDSSSNSKNTTLSFKIFQHPRKNIRPFPKTFQIPLSLPFLRSAQNPFLSLTHRRRWYAGKTHPLAGGERPHLVGKLQVFMYSLVLSLSLVASRFLSPHLSHLTGSAVERDDAVFSHFWGNN